MITSSIPSQGIYRKCPESPYISTLAKQGIPRTTFYRWYDRDLQRGEAGLQDQSARPKHV
ncbi:helix-turn-helix domain-containing protein [Celeribacter sp.]|uniref:helix-turn-helix domain-containing protein n=1 Tax=Celeribacter sp. TaxID=1890673 RepID=UPI003A91303E